MARVLISSWYIKYNLTFPMFQAQTQILVKLAKMSKSLPISWSFHSNVDGNTFYEEHKAG